MVQILRILPGNMAIISTEGLQRVAVPATGAIVEELVPATRAEKLVAEHNEYFKGEVAAAVDYANLALDAPEAGLDGNGNVRIIATLPGCSVVSTTGLQQLRYADGELYLELLDAESAADLRDKHNGEGDEGEYGDPIYAVDYDALAAAETAGAEWSPSQDEAAAAQAVVTLARSARPTHDAAFKAKWDRDQIKVLDVQPGRIVISNEALYRVVDKVTGETIKDLAFEDEAQIWAEGNKNAMIVSYADMAGDAPAGVPAFPSDFSPTTPQAAAIA